MARAPTSARSQKRSLFFDPSIHSRRMSGLPPGTLHRFSRREFFLPAAAISGCDCLNRSDPSAKNASRPARELLAFVAAAVVLGVSIPSPDTVIVIPVFIGIFLLSVLFYVSPAYPWFNRLGRPRMLVSVPLLVLPAALLHAWMVFVRDYRVLRRPGCRRSWGWASGSISGRCGRKIRRNPLHPHPLEGLDSIVAIESIVSAKIFTGPRMGPPVRRNHVAHR
jgi:hypothetical protein